MSVLWRGSWATRARIATGLVLFLYILLHFLNIGLGAISPAAADTMQDLRSAILRTNLGTFIVYSALLVHALLSLGRVALAARLRLTWVDLVQVGFGVTIPLLLATHVVFTRGAAERFEVNDTVGYLSGLIWNSRSGWQQALLLVITWMHGCLGLHMWLRVSPAWRRALPWLTGLAVLVPAFALAGFMTEGRRVYAILNGPDEEARYDFWDEVYWPGPAEFNTLVDQSRIAFWCVVAVIALATLVYVIRQLWRPRRTIKISYVDGPNVSCAPGQTLLEISQANGVPHTSLCGGRGRCTTCRVIVETGAEDLAPPSDAETRALKAVGAPNGARLACQLRPTASARVYRMFQPDGRRSREHASEGKEAQLAILFLDMRSFTSRTTGQLPYDVVFLLNRFFDAIVPAIKKAGGTVDKYLGDGLLAVFELPDATRSAQAGMLAARDIGLALERFNEKLDAEGAEPVRIGLSLHLGTLVLGEIGAAGEAPRTLIGDTVNAASRLEAETKTLAVEGLISATVLDAAGHTVPESELTMLHLRGVSEPVHALQVPRLSDLPLTAAQ